MKSVLIVAVKNALTSLESKNLENDKMFLDIIEIHMLNFKHASLKKYSVD